jgi:hypothetical protein
MKDECRMQNAEAVTTVVASWKAVLSGSKRMISLVCILYSSFCICFLTDSHGN